MPFVSYPACPYRASCLPGASAAWEDYTDVDGHWAEGVLRQAYDDSLMEGYENAFRPDDPIKTAELLTILCRVLSTEERADLSGVSGLDEGDWYYDAAAMSVAMGFIEPMNGRLDLNEPITRGAAFSIIAEAFQLTLAQPDLSALSDFTDSGELGRADKQTAAALVSLGYVEGYGGKLHAGDTITRAEFLTVLYRIVSSFSDTEAVSAPADGGIVLSNNGKISNAEFSGPIFFDCTTSAITLAYVTAETVVLRSDSLRPSPLYLDRSTDWSSPRGAVTWRFRPEARWISARPLWEAAAGRSLWAAI